MTDEELKDLIRQEAEHADATVNDPLPAGAKPVRRNRSKSVLFSVRLKPEELAALHALAADAELPTSTLVRSWILDRIANSGAKDTTTALHDTIDQLVELLALATSLKSQTMERASKPQEPIRGTPAA